MTIKYHFEDFQPGQIREIAGPTLTREDIIEFASRYDPQPFHVDEAAARHSIFGGLVASGWQTVSVCMRMICDGYLLETVSMGSPGMDEVRWTKPVRPGDTLRLKATVLEVRPSRSRPEMGSVLFTWDVFNQNDEQVLRLKGWSLLGRRPA